MNRLDQLFQLAVIGLNHVVQIFYLTVLHRVRKLTLFQEFPDRNAVGWSLVRVDGFRLLPVFKAIQGFTQKAFGRFGVPCRRQVKINRIAAFVDSAV